MRDIRGREISMIFQNPRAALNPIRKVGHQIEDVLIEHAQAGRSNAKQKAIELLKLVRINQPEARYDSYPFELSGGRCRRIVIAIALACRPRLLILDEPTAALDVSVQAVVLNLLVDLKRDLGMSYPFVSHDLMVVRLLCDRIIVMKGGRIVEEGPTDVVMDAPSQEYTRDLFAAAPHPPVRVGMRPFLRPLIHTPLAGALFVGWVDARTSRLLKILSTWNYLALSRSNRSFFPSAAFMRRGVWAAGSSHTRPSSG